MGLNNRFSVGEMPDISVEATPFLLNALKHVRVDDGSFYLSAVADDARICRKAINI